MKDKHIERFDLLKLPDEVVIENQNIELGKLKAYIDELENKITEYEKMSKSERRDRFTNNEIKKLRTRNNQLLKDNEELILKVLHK